MTREIMQQALWALKDLIAVYPETACIETRISAQKVIAALEAELAKPEPVDRSWLSKGNPANAPVRINGAPSRQELVGLTDDEMPTLTTGTGPITMLPWRETKAFIRAIEDALRRKNT